MERVDIERFYFFPEDDFPDFDPEIWLELTNHTFMFGYLDCCYWLEPKTEPERQECITFIDYNESEDTGEITETMWLVHREKIRKMEWANEPPIIN